MEPSPVPTTSTYDSLRHAKSAYEPAKQFMNGAELAWQSPDVIHPDGPHSSNGRVLYILRDRYGNPIGVSRTVVHGAYMTEVAGTDGGNAADSLTELTLSWHGNWDMPTWRCITVEHASVRKGKCRRCDIGGLPYRRVTFPVRVWDVGVQQRMRE